MVAVDLSLRKHLLWVALLASCWILPRLGQQHLWQDEAQTALIARTVLLTGIPHGQDGVNVFSQEQGAEYDADYVWKWHPWLSFYLTAASLRIFGPSAWAARLPFALGGIAAVLYAFYFVFNRWQSI